MRKLIAALVVSVACGTPGTGGTGGGGGSSAAGGGSGGGTSAAGGGTAATGGGTGSAGGGTSGTGGGTGGGTSGSGGGTSGVGGGSGMVGPDGGVSVQMSFFVTSKGMGQGGDLRGDAGDGLTGADRFCTSLAAAVDPVFAGKTWHAYLSTTAVNARDRIGAGPWRNSKGVVVANSVGQLHDDAGFNNFSEATALDEYGNRVPVAGAPVNQHDILTGSTVAGLASANTCSNWTANDGGSLGRVGHCNRSGGGQISTSWNSAHDNSSCSQTGNPNITNGGGRGSFYCFEAN